MIEHWWNVGGSGGSGGENSTPDPTIGRGYSFRKANETRVELQPTVLFADDDDVDVDVDAAVPVPVPDSPSVI